MKEKFDYIYDNYGSRIIWILLAIQAIAISVSSYNQYKNSKLRA